jgi:hypothetical protein
MRVGSAFGLSNEKAGTLSIQRGFADLRRLVLPRGLVVPAWTIKMSIRTCAIQADVDMRLIRS